MTKEEWRTYSEKVRQQVTTGDHKKQFPLVLMAILGPSALMLSGIVFSLNITRQGMQTLGLYLPMILAVPACVLYIVTTYYVLNNPQRFITIHENVSGLHVTKSGVFYEKKDHPLWRMNRNLMLDDITEEGEVLLKQLAEVDLRWGVKSIEYKNDQVIIKTY